MAISSKKTEIEKEPLKPVRVEIEKELSKPAQEISIIKIVDDLVRFAYDSRASDIHIDPEETKLNIRFRIDGILHQMFVVPKELHPEITTRIKVLSGLRTDEHNMPQDGRIRFSFGQGKDKDELKFDVRISIAPTHYGENVVMRLLAKRGKTFTVDDIDFSKRDLAVVKKAIKKPYGMILTTGPTGSGKTTTLYTILKELNKPEISIITIEDPVEYSLEGVEQIQVNPQTGLTFAEGLRSILRQDPNIVMVGEIRDAETAKIAVNAALTGHLLLSTLHTNDAATTLPRLLEMGVEPFLIASTVNVVIAQRLLRKLCPDCKAKKKVTITEISSLGKSLPEDILMKYADKKNLIIYEAKGCFKCGQSGYSDRVAIYETMENTDAIREAITARATASDIKKIAVNEGMVTMVEDGLIKVFEGFTTMEELLRVMQE